MKESVKDKIIGTWKLVAWKYLDGDKEPSDFFGENPLGILTYDASGYMNAQLMKSSRSNFASESLTGGTSEEISDAYLSYAAYWGKYYERTPGELVHEVEGSLFPNWVGHDEIRYAEINGDTLVLSTPPIYAQGRKSTFHVTWKRA
jgi:hypothetical protein